MVLLELQKSQMGAAPNAQREVQQNLKDVRIRGDGEKAMQINRRKLLGTAQDRVGLGGGVRSLLIVPLVFSIVAQLRPTGGKGLEPKSSIFITCFFQLLSALPVTVSFAVVRGFITHTHLRNILKREKSARQNGDCLFGLKICWFSLCWLNN